MRIEQITLREIGLPLVEPFRTTSGTVAERRIVLLELRDVDGTTAWSECVAQSTATYSPETVDTCWDIISQQLARRVLGKDFSSPAALDETLSRGMRDNQMARAAIEMGAWAITASQRGVSLAVLLAQSSSVAAEKAVSPLELVDTGIALGIAATPEELVARVRAALEAGYRRVKLKIEPGRDVNVVGAVREEFGNEIPLSVDANGSYRLEEVGHMSALLAIDGFGLAMIEQPLDRDDLEGLAELQRRLKTPLCLDESITSVDRAKEMIARGSGRVVNIKPGRVGGLGEAVAIHDLCARADIPVWCGGMLECGIGRAYNVALASLPGFTEPGDLSPSARYWTRDVVTPEWTMDFEGRMRVPLATPGIGVEVDADMIEQLTVGRAVLRAT